MSAGRGSTPEQRSAYRAFVRATHPDLGGDPAAFIDGITRWDTPVGPPRRPAPRTPLIHHRRGGAGVFLDWFQEVRRRRRRPPRVQ